MKEIILKSKPQRKKDEGLQMTPKGSNELAGEKRLDLVVVICMGRSVTCAESYEKMSETFRRKFHVLFEFAGKGQNETRKFGTIAHARHPISQCEHLGL